ncbi:hypothetical protein Emin_0537 [Elusimicrobium minutum Pei191]|uniref:Uncharacterized protein n=1 Tax=Elusimicrobium minutum (strain Pei191) TaxID=445932 RepID=B2KCH1_ELUMP|nr:hypothetical protein [Elusimicrobium minutum]ACC98092.1 hypothetical protein Emin_0537 [Elusimicrobium minutum Pei191]
MENNKTGTYKYDAKTGKVIKISSDIPKKNNTEEGFSCPHAHVCGSHCKH